MPRPRNTPASVWRRPSWRRALVMLAALAGCMLVAACGGGSSAQDAASKERASEAKAEAENVKFAKCMREHGVQAETVKGPNGATGLRVGGPAKASAGAEGPPPNMEAAQNACKQYAPNEGKPVNLSPQEKVAQEEAVEKFAKCMREHGINVHASAKEGTVRVRIGGPGSGGPNPESPTFQKAQSACQGLLPLPKGAKKGGLPPLPAKQGPKGGGEGGAAHSEAGFSIAVR